MNHFFLKRCFVLCVSVIFLSSFGYSQDKPRTINESNLVYNSKPPIAIIERSLGGKNFSIDEKLPAGKDWLKDLRLTVKNTSLKTIVFFTIELVIPKSENLTNTVAFPLRFGTPMFILDDYYKQTYIDIKNRKLLCPDETVTISISEHDLKVFTEYLQKKKADDFGSVILSIRTVEFDDFSCWSYGNEYQRDSSGKIIHKNM
jgi:hypothetical protein